MSTSLLRMFFEVVKLSAAELASQITVGTQISTGFYGFLVFSYCSVKASFGIVIKLRKARTLSREAYINFLP